MSRPAPRAPLAALVLAGVGVLAVGGPWAAAPAAAAGEENPWRALLEARESLAAAGPERARFVQSYVPAGFSSGEEESGVLYLGLPDCLRWDYREPFPKRFLLCGDRVWSWNPEDRRGQTGRVDRASQPGLDLLLLPVDELSGRYDARAEERTGGDLAIELEPKPGLAARTELAGAVLTVDPATDRLVEVSYRDREGNRTTFRLSGYRALEGAGGVFEAPEGIAWEESR